MKVLTLVFLATVLASQTKPPVMGDVPIPIGESLRIQIIKTKRDVQGAEQWINRVNEELKQAKALADAANKALPGFIASAQAYCASIKRTFDQQSLSCVTTTTAPAKKE